MADDREPGDWGLPWVLTSCLMALVGMGLLIAAGIMHAGGWSAFLVGPIVLAIAALTLAAVVISRMRSRRHPTSTQHPAE